MRPAPAAAGSEMSVIPLKWRHPRRQASHICVLARAKRTEERLRPIPPRRRPAIAYSGANLPRPASPTFIREAQMPQPLSRATKRSAPISTFTARPTRCSTSPRARRYNLFPATPRSRKGSRARAPDGLRANSPTRRSARRGRVARARRARQSLSPELDTHDRYGRRVDLVRYHPAYHQLMRGRDRLGLHASPWDRSAPGRACRARRAILSCRRRSRPAMAARSP